ncbi:hypothetical protein AB0L71_04680 [Streptomyces sp. NPDC052052]
MHVHDHMTVRSPLWAHTAQGVARQDTAGRRPVGVPSYGRARRVCGLRA